MISVDVNADGGTSSIGMLNEGTTMLALAGLKTARRFKFNL